MLQEEKWGKKVIETSKIFMKLYKKKRKGNFYKTVPIVKEYTTKVFIE